MRHLTPEERAAVLKLVDDCGAPEVLRTIAQLVGVDPTLPTGAHYRAALMKTARDIASDLSQRAPR